MKILIAVSSKEYSSSTLNTGLKVSKAFNASTTIIDVGEKVSEYNSKIVDLAQEQMVAWDFDIPGVSVLEWAFQYLAENKLIQPKFIEEGFTKNTLIEQGRNRKLVYLAGTVCEDVNLVLRNGEIIPELREEVQLEKYDVTIIGGSKNGKISHDLVQYIDSSILVVKSDFNNIKNIIIALDESALSFKALKYGVRVALKYNMPLTIVSVIINGLENRKAISKAKKYLRRVSLKNSIIIRDGDVVSVILNETGKNSLLIMGASTKNPIKKFFTGSITLSVMKKLQSSILVVK